MSGTHGGGTPWAVTDEQAVITMKKAKTRVDARFRLDLFSMISPLVL
jgi:hypothetical protein